MYSSLQKALPLRLLILDVDGVLTTGHIYFSHEGESRAFHVHDGFAIRLLIQAKFEVAVISAKNHPSVEKRLKDLNIQHIYLGQENKRIAFEHLQKKLSISSHEIAYMGDDLPDLAVMKQVGFKITVPDAPAELIQIADLVTRKQGGFGAVREACEWILKAQNRYQKLIAPYLE